MADDFWGQFKKISPDSSPSSNVSNSGDFWGQFKKVGSNQNSVQATPAIAPVQENNIVSPGEEQWANLPEGIRIARQREQERLSSLPEDASDYEKFKSYVGLPVTDKDYDRVKTRAYAASQVPTLGFGDEIYGALSAVKNGVFGRSSISDAYTNARDEARAFEQRARSENPDDYNLGTAIGAVGTTAASVPASIPAALTGLTGSTALGALAGYGGSNSERIGGQALDTILGAGLGLAGGVAGRAIGEGLGLAGTGARSLVNRVRKGKDPLSTEKGVKEAVETLRERASESYKKAEEADVIFNPKFTKGLYKSIEKKLSENGYSPNIQGRIKGVLNEIAQIGDRNVTLKGIDNIRKIANSVSLDGDASERRLAGKIIEIIDRKVGNPGKTHVLMGDTKGASKALQDARKDWRMQAKLSQVADLLDKAVRRAAASGTGGNRENAIRQNLNKILNSKDGRGWTDAEKEAIRRAVNGVRGQALLRTIGKFSPNTSGLGAITTGGAGALGAAYGNPLYLLPAAVGYGAKRGAEALADRNALNVIRTIINDGKPIKNGNSLIPEELATRLIDLLSRGTTLDAASQVNNF